ncbi:MAG TPA: D-alanine--D-alanine ligase [Actinobacteria bacterium]|nr:D-alanine--D-alanine ligase [Actinomycetes bacterium]HEX21333.1 D-alanine--D-alanine ligase [Actinomycetota bacterium]
MKIAVLMGGRSLEREISLKSGRRIYEALKEKGYNAVPFDVDEEVVNKLIKTKPDLVYIALHGKYGEDGTIQELLEILRIPYTGPGVYANIVSFDKVISKEIFKLQGIPTPDSYALSTGSFKEMGASSALGNAIKSLGLPIVVKPGSQGSALGISYAKNKTELPQSIIRALSYGDKVLLEKHIDGTELAVSILGNNHPKALPVVEIVTKKEYFDFEARYTMGVTEYFVPARLSTQVTKKVQDTALAVHEALHCRDVSRVDIILDKNGTPNVLELNTSPGMTETSLLPMAAKEDGISFSDLVESLVKMAKARS